MRRLMYSARPLAVWLAVAVMAIGPCEAQLPVVESPTGTAGLRWYRGTYVGPARLNNTNRIYSLIRAGTLYLTVQDALALAIENNLNLDIARYSLPTADWAVVRAQAGGPIRGVPTGAPQVGASDSGIGVLGAISAAGLGGGGNGGGGGGGNGGGVSVQQVGPAVVNYDPSFTGQNTFSHITVPFANLTAAGVNPLVTGEEISSTQVQQAASTGGSVFVRNYYFRQSENSPFDSVDPVLGPNMRIHIQQPLAQGYGTALNMRSIRVAQNGVGAARENFRGQLIATVANTLNLYWNLVSANDELKARQRALEATQKFAEQTKYEIELGTLARYQLPRAEAEAEGRKQDLILAEATVRQREDQLKLEITRRDEPAIEAAHIVCLDAIEIPAEDNLPAMHELISAALAKRPDIAAAKIADENAEINALGTKNGLLPVVIAYADSYNRGASGQPVPGSGVNSYFTGGYGNALGQIFRRDFPSEYVGIQVNQFPLHNRGAQADYGIEQFQLQASQLTSQRDVNNIGVAISNQAIALRQARARYSTAVNTRKLQEQILEDDRKKFAFGTATFNNLIADERTLVAAQIAEVGAISAYQRARVSLDQVLGQTLEANQVSLDDGIQGQVERQSRAPETPAPAAGNAAAPSYLPASALRPNRGRRRTIPILKRSATIV
jgi:outer membrane protein